MTREARSLFELILRDYADVRAVRLNPAMDLDWDARTIGKQPQDVEIANLTLGKLSTLELGELNDLDVGKKAPEIEGKDASGRLFKLTDYLGKVVLLTFSGNWCGPCKSMYAHQRELVKKYAGKPFAILSVNTDEKLDSLLNSISSGEISWRCWWESGGPSGDLPVRWNVHAWPTVYVLDQNGIIRYKVVGALGTADSGPQFDRMIDQLLGEPSSGASRQ